MTQPWSGVPAVDRYIAEGYQTVRGMSSAFAAGVCGHLMARQTRLGITGHVAEIGTFEGRFLIAMALGLRAGERALGIDTFTWPDEGVKGRLEGHLQRFGLAPAATPILKADAARLTPADLAAALGPGDVRLFHIDGDHSREALTQDLDLALAVLHPKGLIVLDDMLHPGYPLLVVAVHDWLLKHPDMRVVCVIDREDIVGAAKFVLCRADAYDLYENDLMESFPKQHYVLGSEWERWFCVVLTPKPRLAEVD